MSIQKVMAFGLAILVAMAPAAASTWQDKLEQAMGGPLRTETEKARDENRRPVETLEFMRFNDDLRVLELFPGSGWYTKLLAPVLANKGQLYLALRTERIMGLIESTPEFAHVEILDVNPDMPSAHRRGIFDLADFSFWLEGLDLVLTFRNAHNLTPAGRASLNTAVFEALRPGGLYGVVDHTRRHMEPDGPGNRRRADPVRIIHEIQAAGFQLVDWSDLHYRATDRLALEVGNPAVSGRTDRFTLLFQKPAP